MIWHGIPIVMWGALLFGVAKCVPAGPIEALTSSYEEDLEVPLSPRALGHYRQIRAHLNEPFDGYGLLDTIVEPFQAVALSHMACGLLNVARADPSRRAEVTALLDEVVARGRAPTVSPYGRDPMQVERWGRENLYLSHFALILGCRGLCGPPVNDELGVLHERIVRHLRDVSMADGDWHARSFPNLPKFPADQAVTLLALKVYDELHATDLSLEPIRGWLDFMASEQGATPEGLPRSCLDDRYPGAAVARGCALSWTCLYQAQFAPEEAARLYQRYAETRFDQVLGCGGFREWPDDYGGHTDFDTGPIVFGLGVAASGLGIGAARLHGDVGRYAAMLQAADSVGMLAWRSDRRHYHLSPLLGDAILLHCLTATHWFGGAAVSVPAGDRTFAVAAVVVLIAGGLLAVLAVLRILRHARAWRAERSASGPSTS